MLRLAKERTELKVVSDQHGAPTSAELIADITALALHRVRQENGTSLAGTYHLVASGCTSWHGFAQYVLELARGNSVALQAGPEQVLPIPTEAYPVPARRPKNSRLDTSKLVNTFQLSLPDWRYHVRRLLDELTTQGQA